jgi:hypothetical protein
MYECVCVCIHNVKNITQLFRLLCAPPVISTRLAPEPAHSNGCGRLL